MPALTHWQGNGPVTDYCLYEDEFLWNYVSVDNMTKIQEASTKNAQPGLAIESAGPWHTLTAKEVAKTLQTDPATGLSNAEAAQRAGEFGPNELTHAKSRSALGILAGQFKSFIVALLVGVTVVAFALGENIEAIAVLVVIALNASVGFLTEWNAEQALGALQSQAVPTAHVFRGGEEHAIPAAELVPGDIVLVAAGSRVPADGRVIESVRLQIAEAP